MSTSSSQLLSFSQWSCALGCEHSYSRDGSGTIYRTAFVRLRASTLSDPVPKSSRRTLWHVKGQTTGCKFRHNDAEFSNTTQIRSCSTLPQHGSLQPDLLSAVTSASIGGIWQPRSTALSLYFSVFLTRSLSVSHPMGPSLPTRHRCLQRRPFHAVKCSRRDLYTCSCVINIQPCLKNPASCSYKMHEKQKWT